VKEGGAKELGPLVKERRREGRVEMREIRKVRGFVHTTISLDFS
jgi:hypothetical protein